MAEKRVRGTVSFDITGTDKEVLDFMAREGSNFPRGLSQGRGGGEYSPNGDRVLYARFITNVERLSILARLKKLGWGNGESSTKFW